MKPNRQNASKLSRPEAWRQARAARVAVHLGQENLLRVHSFAPLYDFQRGQYTTKAKPCQGRDRGSTCDLQVYSGSLVR